MPGVHKYKDSVTRKLHNGLQGLIKSKNITYVTGHGVLDSATSVRVDDQTAQRPTHPARHRIQPKSLPGLNIDGDRVISSDHALRLDRVPSSVIVLGGGVIGVEFASVWKSFGADVTVVEALPHLLPLEDESSSKLLERAFRRRGIRFELGQRFSGVQYTDAGVTVTLEGGKTITAELLLVAVGRGPVSDGLGFAEAGVQLDRGYVVVDDLLPNQCGHHFRRR